jgi:[acyl-carrier-protein] S-malonyltransferase
MGKIAFLYPGQGSQKVGMGSDLAEVAPELFARYLAACDPVVGIAVTQTCLHGPMDLLSQTFITQPALFSHSLALTDYAYQHGLFPDFVTGHSLGEYTAAVAAGVLSFTEGLFLVCQRGKLMHQIQEQRPGAMAAIIGIPEDALEQLCQSVSEQGIVVIANRNTATQLVVSGEEEAIVQIIAAVRDIRGGRAIRLPVKGAFHSPLMVPVQTSLEAVAASLNWNHARIPLAANVSGRLLSDGQEIHQALLEQIIHPVRWTACIHSLLAAGCDTFLELGSSSVLTRLVKQIAPDVQVYAADSIEKVAAFLRDGYASTAAPGHAQASLSSLIA